VLALPLSIVIGVTVHLPGISVRVIVLGCRISDDNTVDSDDVDDDDGGEVDVGDEGEVAGGVFAGFDVAGVWCVFVG